MVAVSLSLSKLCKSVSFPFRLQTHKENALIISVRERVRERDKERNRQEETGRDREDKRHIEKERYLERKRETNKRMAERNIQTETKQFFISP